MNNKRKILEMTKGYSYEQFKQVLDNLSSVLHREPYLKETLEYHLNKLKQVEYEQNT
jgi:hypothetical protein